MQELILEDVQCNTEMWPQKLFLCNHMGYITLYAFPNATSLPPLYFSAEKKLARVLLSTFPPPPHLNIPLLIPALWKIRGYLVLLRNGFSVVSFLTMLRQGCRVKRKWQGFHKLLRLIVTSKTKSCHEMQREKMSLAW